MKTIGLIGGMSWESSAKQLEKAGADIVVLCTNTMHLCSHAERFFNTLTIPAKG